MTWLEIKWLTAHPVQWARAVWFQLAIAVVLTLKAMLVTDPLWAVTRWSHIGPLTIVAAAVACLASAVAPTTRSIQSFTAWLLGAVAVWRIATYGLLIVAPDVGHTTVVLAQALALHWVIIGLVATQWPVIALRSELEVTVGAGRESLHAA